MKKNVALGVEFEENLQKWMSGADLTITQQAEMLNALENVAMNLATQYAEEPDRMNKNLRKIIYEGVLAFALMLRTSFRWSR